MADAARDDSAPPDAPPALPQGTVLGRYVVARVLGRGGMGVVYRAYDPELERKVALKLLRSPDAASERERARLVREGQALARLAHPNVVSVYDTGTFGDGVFVAMELVDGQTLRAWLAGERRSWRAIVAMFVQAGRGLAAAHAAGIVHRDFKPDNVLVGADGRARVLDFGLAGAVDAAGAAELADISAPLFLGTSSVQIPARAHATRGSLVGTPRYMPAEQLAGEVVDARADQFAFAASVWEALYGASPFEGEDLLTRLHNLREGTLSSARGERATSGVPRWLRDVLARGLSARALDRFPSMDALLAKLEADPATTRWRVAASLGAVVAVVLALYGARAASLRRAPVCPSAAPRLSGVWDDAQRAAVRAAFDATGKPYAAPAFARASSALDAYADGWLTMRDDACQATLVRGQQSSELMDLRMACLDDRLASLRALEADFAHADDEVVLHAVQAADGLPRLADCADAAALRAPVREPANPEVRVRIAAVRAELASGRATREMAKPEEAVAAAKKVSAEAKDIGWGPLIAEAEESEGAARDLAHDTKGASATLREAHLTAVAAHATSTETRAWIELAHVYAYDGQNEEGHRAAAQAHACLDRDGGDGDALPSLLVTEARLAETEGEWAQATALAESALAIRQRTLPPDHPAIADCLNALGVIAWKQGNTDRALDFHRRTLAIREKAFGPDHPNVAGSLNNIALVLADKGQLDDAVAILGRVVAIFTGAYGEDSRDVATALCTMGLDYDEGGDPKTGLGMLQRSLDIRLRLLGPDHPDVAITYGNIAAALNDLGRWDEAIVAANKRYAIQERANGADYPPLARPLVQLGVAYAGKKQMKEAIAYFERALLLSDTGKLPAVLRAQIEQDLAAALKATGALARARELAMAARALFVKVGAAGNVAAIDKEFPPR